MPEVKRTLVKSGPELWAELSDPGCLARHLTEFGSVRILRSEPERLVEWEGVKASGTVTLEPSGFGTRVVLTAAVTGAPESAAEPGPPAPGEDLEVAVARAGFWARLFRRPAQIVAPEPAPERPPSDAEPGAFGDDQALAILNEVLETLGAAHHRPFSRA